MKSKGCGCLLIFNVILGGIATQYCVETWGSLAKHVAIHAPFWICAIAGLFVGEFTIPAAVVTWLLRAASII